MAGGTISLGTSGNIQGRIKWSSSSNGTTANASTVNATIQVKRTNSYTTTGTWKGTLTIGDTKKSYSKYKEVSDSWVTLYSFSETVKHKENGSGTCYIAGVINGPGGTSQEDSKVSESKTVTLDTIARYATLSSVGNFTDEEDPKITYSKGAGSALDSLNLGISLNGSTDIISKSISKTGSSATISLTDAERDQLRLATAGSNTLNLTFILRSRLSGVDYTSKKTAVMTVVNALPTVAVVVSDVNEKTAAVTGDSSILVAGYSCAEVTVSAEAYKGASIETIQITNGSSTITGGIIDPVQNSPIVVAVTDSRKNTATETAPNTIVPYTPPSCFVENGMISGEGKLRLVVTGKFYNAAIGKTNNTLAVQYQIKPDGGDYGTWTEMEVLVSGNEYAAEILVEGLDYQKNHTVQARALDAVTATLSTEATFVSVPVFYWGKDFFKFNVPVTFSNMTLLGLNPGDMNETGKFQEDLEATFATMKDGECKQVQFLDTNLSDQKFAGGIWKYDSQYGVITGTSCSGFKVLRTCANGTWNEWEWENPPMDLNAEYRTAERHKGDPVYQYCFDFGYGPKSTSKTVKHGIPDVGKVLAWNFYNDATGTNVEQRAAITDVSVTTSEVNVTSNADTTTWRLIFSVKYTKS